MKENTALSKLIRGRCHNTKKNVCTQKMRLARLDILHFAPFKKKMVQVPLDLTIRHTFSVKPTYNYMYII